MGGESDKMKIWEYIKANDGALLLGKEAGEFDFFPLLIKLIDSKCNLSILVHPNNKYILAVEVENGKNANAVYSQL